MRELILKMSMSLDGFVAGSKGEAEWVFGADPEAKDGKPIVAHGGAAFARSLIAQNLVDEYALMIHPIVLGQGLPIFSDLPAPRPLKLVSSKAFPGGTVAQIYRRA